jgi:hypothetical protein
MKENMRDHYTATAIQAGLLFALLMGIYKFLKWLILQ